MLAFVRQACGVRAVALCACFAQHHACGIYAYDTHVLVSNRHITCMLHVWYFARGYCKVIYIYK